MIEVFTTPVCKYCNALKTFFKENSVVFTERDLSKDIEAREFIISKTGKMAVPVTRINEQILIGWDEETFKKALDAEKIPYGKRDATASA